MSHFSVMVIGFSVMVIGSNVEEQLAPYHEFECTGVNDKYVQSIDRTDEVQEQIDAYFKENPSGTYEEALEDALSYYGLEEATIDDESKADIVGDECEHKYGYAVVKDGKLVKAVDRTNPNKEWDWWVVGGRWRGFLTGVDGKKHDSLQKGQIDFEAMRSEDGEYAGKAHDKFTSLVGEHKLEKWDDIRAKFGDDIEGARKFYHDQEAIKALKSDQDFYMNNFFGGFDKYLVPREQFVQEARDRALATYAIVKDGEWIAKGKMGWFGMSDENVSQEEWNRKVSEMIDALPDDTWITIVDCHI